ncbi:hypothetical protein M501DRAFT_1000544 [Patellaria atrata CBS 101060]|uniref:Uncharacterized protein n=1 Tax=Patellaria atrata CBS 101060 TaxID=1346257 RepID=A0A9P4VTD6_9PEZI|nr:hypothetical protein M501DRAFT_1000544 [Patellaria atrata CBS 101060]
MRAVRELFQLSICNLHGTTRHMGLCLDSSEEQKVTVGELLRTVTEAQQSNMGIF